MDEIAVVILNWNGRKFLEQFLPSVIKYTTGAKIFVADNNSTDDSVYFVRTSFPEVSLILIPNNEGYSEGYNIALKQINAKYYVLLNSDIEVTPDWLAPMFELMESDNNIAACQPKIKSFFEKNKFEYAGAAGGFIDKWGYSFCRGRIFDEVETDEGQYNDIKEIFWATGACLFIRSESFHKVGGFDKDFFAHMEEIDLCWRLHNTGYKIFYCGKSEIYHIGGGSLSKSNPQKTYLNFRNNLSLLYKNLPGKSLYYILFIRLILDGIAGIKFLFTDSIKHTFAVIRAHISTYINIRQLERKRNALKTDQKIKTIYRRSIVYNYFILKKKKFGDLRF